MEGHKKQPPNTGLERIFYLWFGARCKRVYAVSLDSWERFRCMCDHLRQGKIEGVSFVHIGLRPILFLLCQHCLPCENKHVFGWTIRTWWSQPTHNWSCGTSSKEHCVWCCSKMGTESDRDPWAWAFKKRLPAFCLHHIFWLVSQCIHQQNGKLCAHAEMQIETKKHRNIETHRRWWCRTIWKRYMRENCIRCSLSCFICTVLFPGKLFSSFTLKSSFQVSHWKAVFKFHTAKSLEIISNQS